MATAVKSSEQAVQMSMALLESLLGDYRPRNFTVRLWDGSEWGSGSDHPAQFTLALRHSGALRSIFLPSRELTLGEAYIYDDFDIEGDIEVVFPVADYAMNQHRDRREQARIAVQLLSLPHGYIPIGRVDPHLRGRLYSKERDQQSIMYHYDRSNDFYALWLDKLLIYSCAYFTTTEEDLDTTQMNNLDYICRKLRLKASERLLDVGCGWGGLVMYAAEHYGV
jgi:cyclopropane-fatty-acyl-phospholipid synthase